MKFESSIEVKANLESVKAILNLWAPGAFAFDEPAALSFKLESSLGVTKDSVTVKPILYDCVLVCVS